MHSSQNSSNSRVFKIFFGGGGVHRTRTFLCHNPKKLREQHDKCLFKCRSKRKWLALWGRGEFMLFWTHFPSSDRKQITITIIQWEDAISISVLIEWKNNKTSLRRMRWTCHTVYTSRVLRKMQSNRSASLGLRWAFALKAVWGRTPWFLLLPGKLGEEGARGRRLLGRY